MVFERFMFPRSNSKTEIDLNSAKRAVLVIRPNEQVDLKIRAEFVNDNDDFNDNTGALLTFTIGGFVFIVILTLCCVKKANRNGNRRRQRVVLQTQQEMLLDHRR